VSFVLDNSIALTWCFEDERTPETLSLLQRVATEGAVAPWLWPLEALNGLLMAERRGRLDAGRRHRLLGFLRDLPITLDSDGINQVWTETNVLAERYQLTIYDAVYLELAQRRHLPLATRDNALRAAANALGLPLLGA
jgi:predicted nucleic acid-binding protein